MNLPMRSTRELYPPSAAQGWWQFLCGLTAGDVEKGNFILRRRLTNVERDQLQARASELSPWLAPARSAAVRTAVSAMFVSYGRSADDAGAAATAITYATFLAPLPLWAIERTILRFCSGSVSAADLGEKTIDRNHPPSSAQIAMVARAMVKPFGEESTRIRMTLNGTVERKMSPEQKERFDKKVQEHLAQSQGSAEQRGSMVAGLYGDETGPRVRPTKSVEELERHVLAEYDRAGIAPYRDKSGTLVSLSMLRKNGWTACDVDGITTLVGPSGLR